MTGKNWTLLLLTDDPHAIRQVTLSGRTLRRAAVGVGLLSLLVVSLSVFLVLSGTAHLQARHLTRQNALLAGELEEFRSRVAALDETLAHLGEQDSRLRLLAGLESTDAEVREVGVGGPGLATPEAHPLWEADPALGKSAFAVGYDLASLERRAKLLAGSLSEAADSLQAHRDLLESTPSIFPAAGALTSRFSSSRLHPIFHRPLPHEGVDISAPTGTPILAAAKGRVVFAGWKAGYGNTVELDHGYGFTTLYGHASKLLVRTGQTVARGDVIAQVGMTGIAVSPHLHYEVRIGGRAVNPMNYVIGNVLP